MAFVRQRGNSHQLIETYRDAGAVRQRVIANLGRYPSVAEAVAAEPERFGHLVGKPASDTTVVSKSKPPKPTILKASRRMSRPARWAAAKAKALEGLAELNDIKEEMADWRSNMPEQFEGTAMVEKLDAFEDIDIDSVTSEVEGIEDPEFPRGFGRD